MDVFIGSKDEGIDGIIIDGENGFLVPPNNYQALANKFRLINNLDEKLQSQMQKRAMLTAQEMSTERVADFLLQLFKNL